MNGYIGYNEKTKTIQEGNTEFRWAILDLLVLLKHHYDIPKIFFISNDVADEQNIKDITEFATNIDTYWKKTNVPTSEKKNSNLNKVLEKAISSLDDNTISIVISDYLYSIPKKGNAMLLLPDQKTLTKDAFLSKWKQDRVQLVTTIIKLNSRFTGWYYDKNDTPTKLNGDSRPYYIAIFGGKRAMLDFEKKIELGKGQIEGYDNKYMLSSEATDSIYYSALMQSYNKGRFKSTRSLSNKNFVHGIEDIEINKRNDVKFSFAVAIDLNNIPTENDYLLNPQNYQLNDSNFRIKEITTIDKNAIKPNDWLRISTGNPSHIIVLEATGTALSDVTICLKKQIPQWIEDTNIIDDTDIKSNLDKTFGIKYLIEGIAEAYEIIYPEDKSFFKIEIKIKK